MMAAAKLAAVAASATASRKKPLSSDTESWLFVMPRQRVKPKECDEVPDEFRRAGIGLCFEGEMIEMRSLLTTFNTRSMRRMKL